jgi:hypothetical protein
MMGYIQAGETPYYFIQSVENTLNSDGVVPRQDDGKDLAVTVGTTTFEGIPLWLNLVFAIIVSCVCAGILRIIGISHKKKSFSNLSEERLHSNYR